MLQLAEQVIEPAQITVFSLPGFDWTHAALRPEADDLVLNPGALEEARGIMGKHGVNIGTQDPVLWGMVYGLKRPWSTTIHVELTVLDAVKYGAAVAIALVAIVILYLVGRAVFA